MSPLPRLAALDPQSVAEEAVGLTLRHLNGLIRALSSPAQNIFATLAPDDSILRVQVEGLVSYAQRGEGFAPSGALETLRRVCETLYTAPAPSPFAPHWEEVLSGTNEERSERSPLRLVLLAAWARCELAEGHPLAARELAALASLSTKQTARLIQSGEIAAKGGQVQADEARRWLSSRGVAGFTTKGQGI